MSLIKITNRSGPKWDPCGTPDVTGHILDMRLLIATKWDMFVMYEEIHLKRSAYTPTFSNLTKSVG